MRVALFLLALPAILRAQRDTTALERIVITADRSQSALGHSTAAVTRIEAAELARVPHATIADILRLVPGIAVVNFDGLGGDPQIMARGFYGGGEAEYVVVMVDGKPVDQLHTGLVPWETLPPLGTIEAVEVVRGGSSALYGSSAIGAVINVITRTAARPRWSVSGGTFGTARLEGALGSVSGGLDRTEGYRAHAERTSLRGRVRVAVAHVGELTAASYWRDYDEPGPLLESLMHGDRRQSDSLFRFDNTNDHAHTVTLAGRRGALSAWLAAELRRTDAIRTIVLAPGFGDSKERAADNRRVAATMQFERRNLTAGIDASYGSLDSRYYVFTDGQRGELDASGDGARAAAALFAQYVWQPREALRIALGSRFDWLDDSFDRVNASHRALSPKIGANVRVAANLHVYATASRSFKAPSLDQLFDQRSLLVPFPPFIITTSNSALEPQYGTNIEGGFYQAGGSLTTNMSLYQMDMKDELDFDVQSLRYVNIGRSRHRGLEAAARYEPRPEVALFVNHTLQRATARSGDNSGKSLKAIPRRIVSAGFTVSPVPQWDLTAVYTEHGGMHLDDANTRRLPDYSRLDAHASYRLGANVRLTLEARNVLRQSQIATGFPDPAGGDAAFFYPTTTRALRFGMRYGW